MVLLIEIKCPTARATGSAESIMTEPERTIRLNDAHAPVAE